MTHFQRMGHPDERQLAPGLQPKDIDRGTPERTRLNAIKTTDEVSQEARDKAKRKAEKTSKRIKARLSLAK